MSAFSIVLCVPRCLIFLLFVVFLDLCAGVLLDLKVLAFFLRSSLSISFVCRLLKILFLSFGFLVWHLGLFISPHISISCRSHLARHGSREIIDCRLVFLAGTTYLSPSLLCSSGNTIPYPRSSIKVISKIFMYNHFD